MIRCAQNTSTAPVIIQVVALPTLSTSAPKSGYSITVPDGCYFLMGDNRNHSFDSRVDQLGVVDERYIVGKALWIAVPGVDRTAGNKRDWSRLGDVYDN